MATTIDNTSQWTPPASTTASKPSSAPAKLSESAAPSDEFLFFGDDGFTFFDFIDVINPLQHIPMVNTLYRKMTDDSIDPGSRIAGGTLFFGPLGTISSGLNVMLQHQTGKDVGEHVMAMLDDEPLENDPSVSESYQTAEPSGINPASYSASDPVSDWARSEIAYRVAEAKKQGIPIQPVLTAKNEISPASTQLASLQTGTNGRPFQSGAGAIQPGADFLFSPSSPWPKQVTSRVANPDVSLGVPAREFPYSALPYAPRLLSDTQDQALTPELLTNSFTPDAPSPTVTVAFPGQISGLSKQGNWFASSMTDALSKYDQSKSLKHQPETSPPSLSVNSIH